jgi:hypothetical protein
MKTSEFEWKICNFLSVLLFPRITMQCLMKVMTHNNSSLTFIVDILWSYLWQLIYVLHNEKPVVELQELAFYVHLYIYVIERNN